MIDDMTRIVIDPYYPPKNLEDKGRENLFELLYSELPENACNKRRPFNLDLVYPIPELRQQIGTVKPRNTASNPAISNRVSLYFSSHRFIACLTTIKVAATNATTIVASQAAILSTFSRCVI